MMTRPIHLFDNLTSETTPAGGNTTKMDFSFDERRRLEARARYARAEVMANALGDAVLWLGGLFGKLTDTFKGITDEETAKAAGARATEAAAEVSLRKERREVLGCIGVFELLAELECRETFAIQMCIASG